MAATRLIALHINKGKTVAQCLADRTDYSENAAKTEDGKYISAYACDAKSLRKTRETAKIIPLQSTKAE